MCITMAIHITDDPLGLLFVGGPKANNVWKLYYIKFGNFTPPHLKPISTPFLSKPLVWKTFPPPAA
jgi:hypothetical protein